jgi:hydroxyacyl-ACP dehydratase HTD2-like protein with hotdog domain
MTEINAPVVGASIPLREHAPTTVQLFLFSAATWNPHRIHYDHAYSVQEGYEGVLVQSHLHACFLAQAARSALGPAAQICSLSWQNRAPAYSGDLLTITGEVTSVDEVPTGLLVGLRLDEHNQNGVLCVRGEISVQVPKRAPEESAAGA